MADYSETPLDLLIIGAGIYGTCAASTYLQLRPDHDIVVLDSDEDVGGVWSTSRHYPLFWAQTGARVSGFPDKQFNPPEDAESYHDLVQARWLSKYLEEYVDEKVYDGRSLRERFVFTTTVGDMRKEGGLWRCEAVTEGEEPKVRWAKKVIVATGLSSLPNMPDLPGRDRFRGPILHQKDVGRSRVLTEHEPDINQHENVTIYGGSKSAADLAYAAAKDTSRAGGRKVNWVIRTTGTGPLSFVSPVTPPALRGRFRNLTETGTTRGMACLSSANPYLPANSWREWFLYRTWAGEWLLENLYKKTEADALASADFEGKSREEGTLEGFIGLKPDEGGSVRWRVGQLGLLQRDDYWDVISKKVRIWRGDVVEVEEDAVVLQDGRKVRTDVFLCGTGWKQDWPFLAAEERARLGLPIPLTERHLVEHEKEEWGDWDAEAQEKVYARWPQLAKMPKFKKLRFETTPYRLYRYTLPINDNTIAFLGIPLVPNSYHTALAQSLFAIAALDGILSVPSQQAMREDVAFIDSWCATRYPAHGYLGNVLEFEMVSFTEMLLKDLGLSSHRLPEEERKTWSGWWRDLCEPAFASNYAAIVDEYKRKYMKAGGSQ